MQIQDCPWEIENIGKKTVQLNYSLHDEYNSDEVREAIKGYQYIVAKVPCGNMSCLLGLQGDGFKVMETQMYLSKDMDSFVKDIDKYTGLTQRTTFSKVSDEDDFRCMTESIDAGMFSTDRVSLDPHFGMIVGRDRYVGWMRNEYREATAVFWWVMYDDEKVGFMMLRQEGNNIDCLLNGLFAPYQGKGLGLLTPASPLVMSLSEGIDVHTETTSISSNNRRVVHLYNKLNFKITDMMYVSVSHNTPHLNCI